VINSPTHYIPILTTLFACWFAPQLFRRWAEKRPAPHLFWWGLGVISYAAGTTAEALTTLFGWHVALFRLWYVAGAFLGGAPLAQGTAYLLLKRKTANRITAMLLGVVAVATVCLLLSPIDRTLVQPHRLSGDVLVWSWVALFAPFINTYAVIMLAGGAALSAWRFRGQAGRANRVMGNVAITVGAILPGIGGTFTRFGHVEVLYVTEFLGLVMIYLGFRLNTAPARVLLPATAGNG
jgi:hypothetical protein